MGPNVAQYNTHLSLACPQALDEVINTEAQMKEAREDMDEDDYELLGKKKKIAGVALSQLYRERRR